MTFPRRKRTSVTATAALLLAGATTSAQPHPTPAPAHPAAPHPAAPHGVTGPAAHPVAPAAAVAPAAQAEPLPAPQPAAPVPPPPPPAPPAFRVAFSSGVQGQFSPVVCGDSPAPSALAVVASQFAAEPDTLALDTGDLLGPAAVTRLTLEHDMAGFATAVQASGLRGLALGHRDLAAQRDVLLLGLRALRERGLQHVLSNLHCDATHRALCEAVQDADDPPVLIDSPSGRVGFVATVDPGALAGLSHDNAAGLTLDALADAIPAAVAAARAAGAAHVVVVVDPRSHSGLDDALDIASHFDPGQGPDVLAVQDLPDGVGAVLSARAGIPVVAPRSGNVVVYDAASTGVARLARSGTAPEGVSRFVDATHAWLCSSYAQPLPGGGLAADLSQEAFASLYLDVLRDETSADVAIVNRAAVRTPAGLFPVHGHLTPLSIAAALPFEDTLRVARITGTVLKALATGSRAERFLLRGVTVDHGHVTVNGRDLDEAQQYRIVTTGFIATGGEGGVGDGVEYAPYGAHSAQEVLLGWLRIPRTGDITTAPSDPANHTRWNFRWNLDVGFSSTSISNNPFVPTGATPGLLYTDPQLSRAQIVAVRVDTAVRADADHPYYTWDNEFRVRFGGAVNTDAPTMANPTPTATDFQKNLDLTTYNTALTWRWFRGHRRWFHPLPTFLGYLETELTEPPTPRTPDYHHLLVRPTLGVRFELLDRLTLNVTAGMNWQEVLAPAAVTGSSPEFAIVGTLALRTGTLFSVRGRNIEGSFNADYTLADPGATNNQTLRVSARLSIPLFAPMRLVAGYDVYARGLSGQTWGVGQDATIGLSVAFSRSVQLF